MVIVDGMATESPRERRGLSLDINGLFGEITYSWNPIVGCMHNCVYCWSRKYAARLASRGIEPYKSRGFSPTFVAERLRQRLPERGVVFVSDMGDMWGCYDEETEVLTYSGWKRFNEVTYDDMIACLDPLNNRVIYCKPTRIIKYWYEGKMVRIKSNLVDLLVTPDHNLYVALKDEHHRARKRGMGLEDFALVRAEDCLGRRMRFRRDFPNWEGYEVNEIAGIPVDVFMKFFGYYLARGNSSTADNEIRIQVYQEERRPRYKDIFETMKVVAESRGKNIHVYEDKIVIRGDQELAEYLHRLCCGGERCIPSEIKNLSRSLLNIMLEAYINCNGHRFSETYKRAYAASERLADDLQEVALKCGYIAIVRIRKRGLKKTVEEESVTRRSNRYEIIISREKKMPEVEQQSSAGFSDKRSIGARCYVGYEDYRGYVYCVEAPTHIIYVRRCGKPVWCGNSWVPREWIESVLRVVRSKPTVRFLFLTKNPARYLEFVDEFSDNAILGATIETNRDYKLSRAPPPKERYEAMLKLRWRWKAIFIEPILDFDEEFIRWIRDIGPCVIYVGYDNYGNRLPEPSLARAEMLLRELMGTAELRLGTLRRAWYEGRRGLHKNL